MVGVVGVVGAGRGEEGRREPVEMGVYGHRTWTNVGVSAGMQQA